MSDAKLVPPRVVALAGGRVAAVAWTNELGGVTFHAGDRFIKWVPRGVAIDLDRERVRLAWAGRYAVVPVVLDHGGDGDGTWLVTAALPGRNAVDPRWIAAPGKAVAAIGSGLRQLHDRLPVASCPFDWSVEQRMVVVRDRAARGELDPGRAHADHRHLDAAAALAALAEPPPIDRLVVCHGDTCAPNTLLDDDGRCVGHVDVGALGVADRWADLAIATWSTQWNYGPGWEPALLDAYGIAPDEHRTRYYRLLWDLGT
jgi:aminoglycoside phosphotransferase